MPDRTIKCDIAVTGAGPLGLMAALGLSQAGFDVQLVGPQLSHDGRTTAILNEGLETLEMLGVWQALNKKASPIATMRLVDGSKRLIRAPEARFDAAELDLSAFGYNIKNTDLLIALQQAVEQASLVCWNKHKVTVVEQADGLHLTLENGETVFCHLCVASDGRNSILREHAGISAKKWRYPQTALVMNVSHTRPHQNISTEFHTETGPFTFVPLPDNQSSLVWVERSLKAQQMMGWKKTDLEAAIANKSHALLGDVELNGEPMAYPLSGLLAESFGQNRTVLIGESAHVFPPIGAQGMNLGIRDLKTLLHLIGSFSGDDRQVEYLVATYAKRRQLDIHLRTRAVDALNRSLLSDLLAVQFGRGLGIYALNTLPTARRLIMRYGLGVL